MKTSTRIAFVALIVAASGCLGLVSDVPAGSETTDAGVIFAVAVSEPPESAPVTDATDVSATPSLAEAIETAAADGKASVGVDADEMRAASEALADVPHHSGEHSGYYLRHDGTVVRVQLAEERSG